MTSFDIGVQLHPQATSYAELRDAWRRAEAADVDSIWLWDHFFPLYGDPAAAHFEGWTLLAAMAADTSTPKLGMLVSCNSYRNPELLADMARTTDQISGGRLYFGVGAGWFERDYDEYGYEFGTAPDRLRKLRADLPRMIARLARLEPGPSGSLPLLIGGSGERVTLRLVAEHAAAWNSFGPPDQYARKNKILDEWCAQVGRDPAEIERTVLIDGGDVDDVARYLDAGATHIIVMCGSPYDLAPIERLKAQRTG